MTNDHVHELEQQSIHLIREAHARLSPLAMLWSLGKDSNTLLDVWRCVEREGIPIPELYFARNGKRFRSLGEKDMTLPVNSNAAIIAEPETTRDSEGAGRAMDHEGEEAFERLRATGYM